MGIWLVVGPPLWKIWKSIGMIRNPILMGKCQKWQPNHQPAVHGNLVGGWATPLKNMSSSIGMIRNPILMGKCQKWQPNHQPAVHGNLVGGWATPLKNMSSSIGMIVPNINGKMPKMATKPPTSSSWESGWWLGHPSEEYEFVNWDD